VADHPANEAPYAAIELSVALTEAARVCRETVADYRAGMLGDDELEQALHRCGLVRLPSGTWVLDVGSAVARPPGAAG
jgi:hypothetical protein